MTNRSRKPGDFSRRALLTSSGAVVTASLFPNSVLSPAIAQTKALQVGVLAPLSGVYASLGANKVNGIKMFFNEQQMTVEGTKMQADEANQALKEKRESKGGKRNAAKLGILAIIAEKPMLSDDVYTALEKQGFSGETVKRAASELTKEFQIHRKQRGGRWYMVLAEHLYEFEQETEAEAQPEAVMAVSATEAL